MTKNNLRIISKPHAYLQTMTKTSVKFQKNRHKTVGGVAHTRYIVLYGDGRTDGRKDGRTERRKDGRKAENYVPPLFFEKAGDNNFTIQIILLALNIITTFIAIHSKHI